MKKRLLSLVMALCLALSLLPVTALADGEYEAQIGETQYLTLPQAFANAKDGDTITLLKNVVLSTPLSVGSPREIGSVTLNMAGKTITYGAQLPSVYGIIKVRGDSTALTITGNGTFQLGESYMNQGSNGDSFGIVSSGINGTLFQVTSGNLIIENGTFIAGLMCVEANTGTVSVKGGTFSAQKDYQRSKWLLNKVDSAKDTTIISVTGGSFVGFNPANCTTDGSDTSYVPAEYESTDTNGTWTVTKKTSAPITVDASDGTSGTVNATVSGVTLPESDPDISLENTTLTVDATADSGSNTVTTANVTVSGTALNTIATSESVGSVAIKTDVGTLTMDAAAKEKIFANAAAAPGVPASAVTLTMEKKTTSSEGATYYTYSITAVNETGKEVYSKDNARGSITVSISNPYGSNASAYVYYVGENGPEKINDVHADNESLTWTVSHFSDYVVTQYENGLFATGSSGTIIGEDLNDLLKKLNGKAGSYDVYLASNVVNALDAARYTITADITFKGGVIDATVDDGKDTVGFTITGTGGITLDGTKMTISGTVDTSGASKYNGTAFSVTNGSKLTVKNGANLELKTLNKGFIVPGTVPVNATITVDNAVFTADGIDGNFSNGGIYDFKNNAQVEIRNCDDHALSAYKVTVDKSELTIENAGKRGISINENGGLLTITQNGVVNVTNCGTGTIPAVYMADETDKGKYASLKVYDGSTLNVTATATGKSTDISISPDDNVKNNLAGTIVGDISGMDGKVAMIDGDKMYDLLDDAVANAGWSQTIRLLTTTPQILTKKLPYDATLVIAAGQTVNVTDLTAVAASQGTIKVEAGGALQVAGEEMIGGNGSIKLTDGYVNLSKTGALPSSLVLKLDFKGAKVEVPTGKRWTTVKNVEYSGSTIQVPINVAFDAGSTLTVNGSEGTSSGFHVANGSVLTNEGTIVVNSSMSIGSSGEVTGSGTITVSAGGVLEVDKTNAGAVGKLANNVTNSGTIIWNGANASTLTGTITLAAGGKVYSQANIADKVSGSKTEMSNKTYSGETFAYAWQYYVAPTYTGSSSTSGDYLVSVESSKNGKVTVSPSRADKGNTVTITVKPDDGYELSTLTVTDKNGDSVKVTYKRANKYTFTMPGSKVTIEATFVEASEDLPFTDVAESAWYYDAVKFVYDNDLMNGVTTTTFGPNVTTSRAMIATILYRLEGSPRVTTGSFTDVESGMYYTDAVAWASSKGIVTGYGDGTFLPNKAISREEIATMLYRYASYKGYDVTIGEDTNILSYADAFDVSEYAIPAMQWACGEGLITDMGDGTLNPQGNAVRAQVATILMRFLGE